MVGRKSASNVSVRPSYHPGPCLASKSDTWDKVLAALDPGGRRQPGLVQTQADVVGAVPGIGVVCLWWSRRLHKVVILLLASQSRFLT